MCCRLYFGRIVPTILDYLSASVEMSTLGLPIDIQSLHPKSEELCASFQAEWRHHWDRPSTEFV
jgi:hypothetical protein